MQHGHKYTSAQPWHASRDHHDLRPLQQEPARQLWALIHGRYCRDAIMLQHSYDMPARGVQYSICDNLLLVFRDAGVVHIIDVDTTASAAVSGPQAFHLAHQGVRLESSCECSFFAMAKQ